MESMTAIFVGAIKDWLYEEKDGRKFKLRKLSMFAFYSFKPHKCLFRDYELKEAEIEKKKFPTFFSKAVKYCTLSTWCGKSFWSQWRFLFGL